jgi:PAS domain-containing protein
MNSADKAERIRLEAENKFLRSVLNQIPSELVVVDTDMHYLSVNKALQ